MNKLFRRANDWDKADKAQLTDGIKTEVSRLRRAEQLGQKKRKRGSSNARFVKILFKFTKKLLGEERSETLHCSVLRGACIYMKHTMTQ